MGGATNADATWAGGSSTKLLVAEDDPTNQIVAVAMLEKQGYQADIAPNGRQAVEMCGRATYGAVFMDCQMPELDGYEATREIRRREKGGPRLPIIAMTAHSMTTDRDKCIAAGMDDYLSKPVSASDLGRVLAR